MKAEIITIGDEILIGQIVDTNSQWLGQRLNEIGVSVYQITSIQDDKEHIVKAVEEAEQNADIVIMTGGLGPTKDDITKLTLAEYFDDKLTYHEEVEHHIKHLFGRIKYKFTDMDLQQAMLPAKATILKNHLGTASGMWFERNKKVFISLPGVPNEMKGLISGEVLPKLREKFHLPFIMHKTLHTYGLGESRVAERLTDFENDLPDIIKLAYLPSYGRVRLRLTTRGTEEASLKLKLDEKVEQLKLLVKDIYVGEEENTSIERTLNELLSDSKQTLSLAESCTGGNISRMITSIPGASNFLKGALVAYSAAVKTNLLGVEEELINKHSVVSKEVAIEMALRCQKLFATDYAVSTTGNAGPSTDETDKMVGVVFIGIASPSGVYAEEFFFGKPRDKVIERASVKALELLRKEILKNSVNSLPD
ncbi:competence/damage-inducible protein A [Lutimonas sp.]|jgi:nicotinamide-nucleotide amidase|uniref:competence/damage-inducible protein A n=1 Tax=Lutimonas sp. TaxID=1872403 RepID=UPI003C788138